MKTQIAKFLHRIGISANILTVTGLLLAALAGWLVYQEELFWAAAVLLASGIVDLLDGAVARVSGKDSPFGGIFDSSLDRYGDAFVFMGTVLYFFQQEQPGLAVFSMSAWTGSFLISYIRARAECEIDSCRVGFWERGERLGVLILALAVNNLPAAVMLLGIGTHWTALQRLYAASPGARPQMTPSRSTAAYFLKLGALVAILLFARLP